MTIGVATAAEPAETTTIIRACSGVNILETELRKKLPADRTRREGEPADPPGGSNHQAYR